MSSPEACDLPAAPAARHTGPDGPANCRAMRFTALPRFWLARVAPETVVVAAAASCGWLWDAAGQAPVPAGACNVGAQLLAKEAGVDGNPLLARVHLGSGHWLTLCAARMDSAQPVPERDIAVTIETTAPGGRVSLFARAIARAEAVKAACCGLDATPREMTAHRLRGSRPGAS